MLFETGHGRSLLGPAAPATRALVFNVKGEDLLHIDRPNARYAANPDAMSRWHALGVDEPGPFSRVRLYAPRSPRCHRGAVATDVVSREASDVLAYGWSPEGFIREGLLRFCLTAPEDAGRRSRSSSSACACSSPDGLTRSMAKTVQSSSPSRLRCSYNFDRIVEERRDRGLPVPVRRSATSPISSTSSPRGSPPTFAKRCRLDGGRPGKHADGLPAAPVPLTPRLGQLITGGVHRSTLDELVIRR